MALDKLGYKGANQGTTRVNVAIDENGYIAQSGTVAASTKRVSINKVSAENSRIDNEDVLNFFIGLVGGRYDRNTNQMQVTWSGIQEIEE